MLFNELPKYSCSYSYRREIINSEDCYQKTYSRFGFIAESNVGRTVKKLIFKKVTKDPVTGEDVIEYTDEIFYECVGTSNIGTSYIIRTENNDLIIERRDKTAKTAVLNAYYGVVASIFNYTGWKLIALVDNYGENVEVELPRTTSGASNWRYICTIANLSASVCLQVVQ